MSDQEPSVFYRPLWDGRILRTISQHFVLGFYFQMSLRDECSPRATEPYFDPDGRLLGKRTLSKFARADLGHDCAVKEGNPFFLAKANDVTRM
jgi:hypothetical protein